MNSSSPPDSASISSFFRSVRNFSVSGWRFCTAEDVEVPFEHIVKGYELSRGRYVMVTAEELEAADPKGARTLEIQDFVELAEIDPIYYDQTYYLGPDRGAGKAYALLLDAMRRTGKVGIARVVLRTKETLCCVRPMGSALALSTMNYADEVVGQGELELPERAEPAPRELEMAERLVESLTTTFEPGRYRDTHRDKVLALIERKAAGEQVVAPAEAAPAKVVNLADALAASLAAARRQPAAADSQPPPERAHRAAPRREAARAAGHRKKRGGS